MLTFFILMAITTAAFFIKPLWFMNGATKISSIKRHKNLAYDQQPRHLLDIYQPASIDKAKPVIVFVHGGSWDFGNKDDYQFVGDAFAKKGFITAVPNYRLYPTVRFPHFIEDVAEAINSLPKHLIDKNLVETPEQPLNIILVGHSAGAHTVTMLSTDKKYLSKSAVNVKACIGLAGPYDLPLDDPNVIGKFDGVELHELKEEKIDEGHEHNSHDANPINLATQDTPSTLLLYGMADKTVGLYHVERYQKKLDELNVQNKVIFYPKAGHRELVGAISSLFHFMYPVLKDITDFIESLEQGSLLRVKNSKETKIDI